MRSSRLTAAIDRPRARVRLRLLDLIPPPAESAGPGLAVHVTGTVVRTSRGVATGSITGDEEAEPRLAKELDNPGLMAFARQCFDEPGDDLFLGGATQCCTFGRGHAADAGAKRVVPPATRVTQRNWRGRVLDPKLTLGSPSGAGP